MKFLLLSVLLIGCAGFITPAYAEDKAAARTAYAEGSKYYDLNQYAEALEAFKRAYWNYEEPSFLFNIAQCHRALRHKSEAVDFYRSYLRKAPQAGNREEVRKIIGELELAIANEKTATTAPPNGTIGESKTPPAIAVTAPVEPVPAPVVVPVTAEPPPREQTHKSHAWVWGVVAGGIVVVALGVGLGVGLGTAAHDPNASFGKYGLR